MVNIEKEELWSDNLVSSFATQGMFKHFFSNIAKEPCPTASLRIESMLIFEQIKD